LYGIFFGGMVGAATGLFMHFGWITTHKPFSRSEYIKEQEAIRRERKGK